MRDGQWAAPVGGAYWLMSVLLPKYFAFRYPAKLFVVASLTFCLLAGRALGPGNWLGRLNVKSTVVTFIALATIGCFLIWGIQAIKQLPGNSTNAMTMFGPFQTNEAIAQVYYSLGHLFVLSSLIWLVCRLKTPKPTQRRNQIAAWCLVCLTAIDLGIANRWVLAEIPASVCQNEMILADELESLGNQSDNSLTHSKKLFASGYVPLEFETNVSQNRLAEIADWQRQTLQAKYHLNQKVRLVGSFHSIWPRAYQQFNEAYLADLKTAFWSGRGWESDPAFLLDEYGEEIETLHATEGERDDLRLTNLNVSVDSALQAGLMTMLVIENPNVTIESECFDWNETRFQILAHRNLRDQWLELPVLFDDGWQVQVRFASGTADSSFEPVPFKASRRDLLQIQLPDRAGRFEVELNYRPGWFWPASTVSLVSWVLVVGWMLISFCKRVN